MKYPKIVAQVPAGEHFDDSAVNEGVWLTVAHLNNIEGAFDSITGSEEKVGELTVQIDGLVDTAVKDAATIRTQSARIVELEATVEKLEAKPSGNGSVLRAGAKDDSAEGNVGTPSYLDPNDPINQFADSKMRKRKS